MKKVLFLAIALLIGFGAVDANGAKSSRKKTVNLHGEYTYIVPENITLEEAKQIALQQAILKCLGDEFGTLVSQNNAILMQTSNGKTDMLNYSIGGTEVKGEWLGHTKDPKYTISYQEANLVVKAEVWGKARELKSIISDISVKVLCNGTDDRHEREIVYEGDRFYVSVNSVSSGYICMYLIDENANAVCLLPYIAEQEGSRYIEKNKKNIFFSYDHAEDKSIVDEYIMSCTRDSEVNTLYLIFSPNQFSKPIEDIDSDQALTLQDLDEWLLKTRLQDPEMQVIRKNIIIKKVK